TAPQMRRQIGGGIAIADRIGVGVPIGGLAVAIFALMAPFAGHVRQVMFEQNTVPLFHSLALQPFTAGFGDDADILVTHDDVFDFLAVILHIAAADAGDLHLDQRRLGIDFGHVEFAV